MNLNIVIRANYKDWFDIDVNAEDILGENFRELDMDELFDLINEYIFNTYGENHEVKMWTLGDKTEEEEEINMENYIRLEMNSSFTEGVISIHSNDLICGYRVNGNYWINNMPRWIANDYPVNDVLKYFELINLLREKDLGAKPLKAMNFELLYEGCGKYSLKDERVLSHLG